MILKLFLYDTNGLYAVGPMESLLMAAASCSTIDIVMILKKIRQPIEGIKVEVNGVRRDEIPKTYTDIHMHYKITGQLKKKKYSRRSILPWTSIVLFLLCWEQLPRSHRVLK